MCFRKDKEKTPHSVGFVGTKETLRWAVMEQSESTDSGQQRPDKFMFGYQVTELLVCEKQLDGEIDNLLQSCNIPLVKV